MCNASERKADLLYETFGKDIIDVIAFHIKKLILDRGTAAVDNQDNHIINI